MCLTIMAQLAELECSNDFKIVKIKYQNKDVLIVATVYIIINIIIIVLRLLLNS